MISFIFSLFFKKTFFHKTLFWKLVFEFLSIFFTLLVIYYASESFEFKTDVINKDSTSLFLFLLVGEISLALPMSFSERFLAHFLEIRHLQFYQTLIGLRISPTRFVFGKTIVDAIFPLTRVLLILLFSAFVLGFKFSFFHLAAFFLLQFFAVLIFIMMALITTLVYLTFNRGVGIFHTFQSLAAILSGVYFPIGIFPHFIKNVSIMLPQTKILEAARLIFQGHYLSSNIFLTLLIWFLILFGIWLVLDRLLVKQLKQKSRFF